MVLDRVTFYEAVTVTVKLSPLTDDDEHLVGDSWLSLDGQSIPVTLQHSLPTPLAIDCIIANIRALPEDRYLLVYYFLDHEGVRVGFFRSSSPEVLEWGDRECPPWFLPPVYLGTKMCRRLRDAVEVNETPSRWDILMDEEEEVEF
jgi:hypothetical protein